ncbi:MAG TPA: hypothetical protein VK760_00400, partial [Candidatus Acidoferrales bacterium]|nr:hypothetical protein [Candidatus Acidoferrales bacterium]
MSKDKPLRKRYAEAFSRCGENAYPRVLYDAEIPMGAVTNDGFSLREATQADVSRIAAVHVASWDAHYRGILDDADIDRRTLDVRIEHWTNRFAVPNHLTYVAESDDGTTMYGFASALVLPNAPDGFDAYLGLLYLIADA